MPLTSLQSRVLSIIAAKRDPESFVAGGTPINREGPRYSSDIDIFHDREQRVAEAAEADARLLQSEGLEVSWIRRQPAIQSISVRFGMESTKIEWVADSDYRFFPTVSDPIFGSA